MITFGPIPSRRLGRSLGINNIPPKSCSYSCVYCQVGPTYQCEIEPREFYSPREILAQVESALAAAERAGTKIDYLTFVPDGEPTLDINLAESIGLLRPLGFKIAVISNASLIWRKEIRERLMQADWLSLKVDTTREDLWRCINRPHPELRLQRILDGILEMGEIFNGELTTETMLVDGINDGDESVLAVGAYLERLNPVKAYLAIPIRPGAEAGTRPPAEDRINRAFQLLVKRLPQIELLIGYEGNAFSSTGDLAEDLLAITSVHPMRESAVKALLRESGGEWKIVDRLLREGRIKETEYQGRKFYLRAYSNSAHQS